MYQNGLVESKDYSSVCECLTLKVRQDWHGLVWQMKLQCRVQRPGESLLDFAGELRMIATKALPDWSNGQLEELVRNQFIQGLVSPTVQMQLMKDMPHSINDAVELARKLETAEQAQRRAPVPRKTGSGHGCMRLETGCTIRQFTVSLYNSEVTPHYSHPMFQNLP